MAVYYRRRRFSQVFHGRGKQFYVLHTILLTALKQVEGGVYRTLYEDCKCTGCEEPERAEYLSGALSRMVNIMLSNYAKGMTDQARYKATLKERKQEEEKGAAGGNAAAQKATSNARKTETFSRETLV